MTLRLLALAALASAAIGLAAPPAGAQVTSAGLYQVQPGDTLYRIARANGLGVDELKTLNGLADNTISVGQTLRLTDGAPVAIGMAPPPEPPVGVGEAVPATPRPDAPVHVVSPGETLFRIALRYGTTVGTLRRLNGITGDQIEVGQRLVVADGAAAPSAPTAGGGPARPAVAAPIGTLTPNNRWSIENTTVPSDLVHFVEPGETLYSVAASRGVSMDELVANNSLSTAPLEPGKILYLPRASRPPTTDAVLPDVADAGLALVYPDVMSGRRTASGESYDPLQFTASHRTLPFGTLLLVTNPGSGRTTFVRVIDRGPVSQSYLIELSAAAASALDLDPNAARRVELRELP